MKKVNLTLLLSMFICSIVLTSCGDDDPAPASTTSSGGSSSSSALPSPSVDCGGSNCVD